METSYTHCDTAKFIDYPRFQKQSTAGWPAGIQGYKEQEYKYRISPASWVRVSTPAVSGEKLKYPFDVMREDIGQDFSRLIGMFYFFSGNKILHNRLIELMNDAKEEDSRFSINFNSLNNFLNFILSNTKLKNPAISLTPDFFIYASWRGVKGQLLSVLFLPEGETRFVIFKPNDLHPEKKIRISGAVTTDRLMETVQPHGVWEWISE